MSYGAAGAEETKENVTDLSWVDQIIHDLRARTSIPSFEPLQSRLPAVERPVFNIYNPTTIADNQSIAAAVMVMYSQTRPKEITSWGVTREINHYVARETLEREITERLSQNSTSVIAALKGMGGIGKTVLASHILHARSERIKIWFNAESRQALYEQYETFLMDCDLLPIEKRQELVRHPNKTEIVISAVKRYLAERRDWLVVYDNAHTYAEIVEFLPPPHESGKVIITSQSKEWPRNGLVEVDVMTEAEAINLITEIVGEHNHDDLKALIRELGYFPLAITQAAAYMIDQRMSPRAYLGLYQARKAELLREGRPADHLHVNVWVTFVLALEKIYEQNHLAAGLLYYTGWLSANDIPLTLLGCAHYQNSGWLSSQLPIIKQALSILEKYSLLKGSGVDDKAMYSVHRVLQKFLQVSMIPEIEYKIVVALMKGMQEDYQLAYEAERKNTKHFRVLISHFEQLDHFLRDASVQAVLKREQSAHLVYAEFLMIYALCKKDLGEVLEAKELFEETLTIEQIYHGKEHVRVSEILIYLASVYGDIGDNFKKKELLEKALAVQASFYGKDNVKLASILNNLGNAYLAIGNFKAAKKLFMDALKIKEANYGKKNIKTAPILVSLATAHGELGDIIESKKLLEDALAIQELYYGKGHADLVITLTNLATVYWKLGDHLKQKQFLEEALVIQEPIFGKNHIEVAITLSSLAVAYNELGDNINSLRSLERALPILKKHYGERHIEVAKRLAILGNIYGDLGDGLKKKQLLEKALETYQSYYGQFHIEVGKLLSDLGVAYSELGDNIKAKELLERALSIHKDHFGESHIELTKVQVCLGDTYRKLGNSMESKALLEKALAIQEPILGGQNIHVARTLNNLALTYITLDDNIRGKQLLERALPIFESHFGKDSLEVAKPLLNLACVLAILNKTSEALLLVSKCENIFSTQPGGGQYLENCRQLRTSMQEAATSTDSAEPARSGEAASHATAFAPQQVISVPESNNKPAFQFCCIN